MVLIMTTTWIPQGKETEAGERYLKVMREYPKEPFEKAILPLGVISTKEGTKVINIVDVKKGQYERAINIITKRMLQLSCIKGLHYQMETLLSGDEALSLISIAIPQEMIM